MRTSEQEQTAIPLPEAWEKSTVADEGARAVVWRAPGKADLVRAGNGPVKSGTPWGSKVTHRSKQAPVVRPTVEHVGEALERRTAVPQGADVAGVVAHLGIRPGFRVVEAGTGAGFATVAFGHAVGEEGQVITCEYHEERAKVAKAALEPLLGECLAIHHRDFLKEGAPVGDGEIDACFFDLPGPERVVPEAHRILREGGAIGFLTPCIEQAQAVANDLRYWRFAGVRCEERLLRELRSQFQKVSAGCAFDHEQEGACGHEEYFRVCTRPAGKSKGHAAFLTFAHKPVEPE